MFQIKIFPAGMFKKSLFLSFICLTWSPLCLASVDNEDALHLAGVYRCHGHDSHDGDYKDAVVTLTLDRKNSLFSSQYGAYHFSLTEADGAAYAGAAAAYGDHLAIYFKNTEASKLNDQGVGIAVVVHDKGAQGRVTTSFRKFYYEPHYQGGGNGFETCIKQ